MLEFNFVFCMDIEGGISKDNQIPWKVKEDTKYFRDVITRKNNSKKNIIICGKKTYRDMGPIKNHLTLVLTKSLEDKEEKEDNVVSMESVDATLQYLKSNDDYGSIYICGGKKVYDEFFHLCQKYQDEYHGIIYATVINKSFECDNFLNSDLKNLVIEKAFNHFNHQHKNFAHGIDFQQLKNHEDNSNLDVLFLKPFDTKGNFLKTNNFSEMRYLEVMSNILNAPEKVGRNGTTRSLFGEMIKFKMDKFPLLTTKRVYFKGVFEELMFFLKGDTNAKHLHDKDVKIWDLNTTKEFINSCNLDYEEGDMGPMYGFQWRHFNAPYESMHTDYTGQGYDQLEYVLHELKTNPNSRRIIMSTYNPAQAKQGVLFPCHGIGIVFNTSLDTSDTERKTFYLNIMQLQRSCDYFLGVPFNIASYSLLVYMICEVINNDEHCKYKYKPGELTMTLGDYHLYETHYEEAMRQLVRTPNEFPILYFNKKIYKIEDFKLEDIELINYNCWPEIKATMVQ